MRLHYTPRSHFARKVRILLDAWGLDVELIDVGVVGKIAESASDFGGNPLMKIPSLFDEDQWLIDSDNIASYLTRTRQPTDPFSVLTTDVDTLNARAVMNGVMAAEVELLLAQRSGLDTKTLVRFQKITASINRGLAWLNERAEMFGGAPSYAGFHLVCLWDHLALYTTTYATQYEPVSMAYPTLEAIVATLSAQPFVSASAPKLRESPR